MNIGLGFRHMRSGPFNRETVERSLQELAAEVTAGWDIQHGPQGEHTDVTARTVLVEEVDPQSGTASGSIALRSAKLTPETAEVVNTLTISNTRLNGARMAIDQPPNQSRLPNIAVLCTEKSNGATATTVVTFGRITGGLGTGAAGAGVELDSREVNGGQWAILASDDNYFESLGFFDVANAVEVLKLYRTGVSAYTLQPSEDGIATVKLGDHTDSDFVFDECAALVFYEGTRAAAVGYWTSVAYNAGNFTASTGTWTVDSGDQNTYAYALVGKTLTLAWDLTGTDVSANSVLRLAIPGGFTAAKTMYGVCRVSDAGAAHVMSVCRVVAGTQYVELYATSAGTAFTITAADNTQVQGTFAFEIQ